MKISLSPFGLLEEIVIDQLLIVACRLEPEIVPRRFSCNMGDETYRMNRIASKAAIAFVISLGLAASLFAQSKARRQTFEGMVILPNGNAGSPPTASIAGNVVAEVSGEPLVGATVTLSRHFGSGFLAALLSESEPGSAFAPVRTNAKGGFLFQGVEAGAYDLAVQMDGYLPRKFGQPTGDSVGGFLTLASDQHVNDLKLELPRLGRLQGRIRSEMGQVASNVPVQLFHPNTLARIAETRSTADGSYDFDDLSPARYILVAGSPTALNGEPARSFATAVIVPTNDPQRLDFPLDANGGYNIKGNVTLESTGSPPAAVRMTVYGTPGVGNSRPVILKFAYDPQVGSFEIPGLFPGTYEIHISPDDDSIGNCASTNVMVSRTDVTGLEFTLGPCNGN
jgi:hypothetical protein